MLIGDSITRNIYLDKVNSFLGRRTHQLIGEVKLVVNGRILEFYSLIDVSPRPHDSFELVCSKTCSDYS